MSLPDEKIRALQNARDLLLELASGWRIDSTKGLISRASRSDFKRVPKPVREACRRVLRHYPLKVEIEMYWNESSDRNPPPVNRKRALSRRSRSAE